jgi:acyl carrier protein
MMVDSALRDQVFQRLLDVSDAKITAADISSSTSLREDLDIDSMNLVVLVTDLEAEWGVNIDDGVLKGIQTIGDLFKAIENAEPRSGAR